MMNDEFLNANEMNSKFERDKRILQMIELGLSYAEIGRQIGLTRARVSQIALDNGYVVRPSLVNVDKRKTTSIG
jgi:transcriptional regulator